MGKQIDKIWDEQKKAQWQANPDAQPEELPLAKAFGTSGPHWYNAKDKTVNAQVLAGDLIDMMGLYRRSGFVYNGMGQLVTDAEIVEAAAAMIMPVLPEKAATIARFSVLTAFKIEINKIPMQEVDTADNSIGQYITGGRMQEEIKAFIAASDVKTGFYQFDRLAGGLYPGLYVIGAISSLGKTTFVQQLADNVAAAGKPVLFFSLEMSMLELASKSISRKTAQLDYANAVSSLKIRAGVTSRLVEQATEAYTAAVGDKLQVIEGAKGVTLMLQYRYDTQLLIEGQGLDEDEITDWILENMKGDSLICVGDDEMIKIHFHTNEPWDLLSHCATLGEIFDIVVEDMDRPSRGLKG